MTDKKTPLISTEKTPKDKTDPATKIDANKDSSSKKSAPKADTKKIITAKASTNKSSTATATKNGFSKLALLALVVAIAGSSGLFLWQQQQSQLFAQQIAQKNDQLLLQYQQQSEQALLQQKNDFSQQLNDISKQINNTSKGNEHSKQRIVELNNIILQLEQNIQQRQPSDWLLHEAEYLIRIAARTLWLEHDTTAAIGLLQDADARLTELNSPTYLPVRELIHQDIKSLQLMPTLQTDEVVLALMAMNKQVKTLPLAIVDLGADQPTKNALELSENINDWQSNLAKTWHKFLDDFIRVRQRSGTIEPLMSPEQQQHLKQNLSLKIQLALWAATERKSAIYQQTLADIQQWFTTFFDMEHTINQGFVKALSTLQQQRVSYNYSSDLSSLVAIRTALTKQTPKLPFPTKEPIKVTNASSPDTSSKQTPQQPADKAPNEKSDEGAL